jgi:hypothetical protein
MITENGMSSSRDSKSDESECGVSRVEELEVFTCDYYDQTLNFLF